MKKFLIKLLYPYRCPFCGQLIEGGICRECQKKLEFITSPVCLKCGRKVAREQDALCPECEKRELFFDAGRGLFVHKEPVRTALYNLKFHNQRYAGEIFGKLLARRFGETIQRWEIDCVIPVPLSPRRQRKRGFNQAEAIARPFAEEMGLICRTDLIYRWKDTMPSKYLTPRERRKNLQDAFGVQPEIAQYRNILLIDDIYTTGATVSAISKKIKEKDVKGVYFLTASIGQ